MVDETSHSSINRESLAHIVELHRDDFVNFYKTILRKNIFINHIQIRPADIEPVCQAEVEAFIFALRNNFSNTSSHGAGLCKAGLGVRTIFEMHRPMWFFIQFSTEDDIKIQELTAEYRMYLLEGYMEAREKQIIMEQETIRSAFEIAMKRSNDAIHEAQAQLLKATEDSHLNTITAQEDERRRISRELHDDAGQAMMGIKMSLEKLKSLEPANKPLITGIDRSIELTDAAITKIRTVAYSLRPPMLDILGIHRAIKQLCVDFSEHTNLIILYTGEDAPPLNDELAISIYRIVQESLTNIVKHSGAHRAWIRFQPGKNKIKLNIIDDGKGFDTEEQHTGIGLASMKERCRLLNGKFVIKSSKGSSTLLAFTFPILHQAEVTPL